ncbi:hypothetical protein LJC09_00055 [Desulfovibrio sp. OttesenSCG-928-F20]|nr:hypothetical protein [Desulfovibrio sp. OttesenSCG-928-F20]
MLRSTFLALTLSCILVCTAQPSFAARQDAGAFSAEVPNGWTMTKDDEMTTFAEAGGPVELIIILKKYQKQTIEEVMNEMVGQTPVKFLADNIYIYEDSSGSRGWSMLAADGSFADISVNMNYVDIRAFLASLKAADNEKGLGEIFKVVASSQEVIDWLGYTAPPFAETENGDDAGADEGTPYEHKNFTAIVPKEWGFVEQNESVVFSANAKDAFVIVRVFELDSDDGKAFTTWATEQVKALDGKNINAGEGVVEFTTAKGASGMFTQFDKKSLFLLFGGENPQIGNLIKSIGLKD